MVWIVGTDWVCMQRSKKPTKCQEQCLFLAPLRWSFRSRWNIKWFLYSLLFFSVCRATTGQITTSPLRVRIKNFLKIARLDWCVCGRWEFNGVCLFGQMDVCRCLRISIWTSPLLFTYALANYSLMLSQVCARGVWCLSVCTRKRTYLRASEQA